MALPLVVDNEVLGAITVQSEKEAAFNNEDISTLQTMADLLAVAIKNAYTLNQLEEAHQEILTQKTFEALATSTTQAIHWIGNKALPITTTARRMQEDLDQKIFDLDSIKEDIDLILEGSELIVEVKEKLIGQAREHAPRPLLLPDLIDSAILELGETPVKFIVSIDDPIPTMFGDSSQLVQGLAKLLTNSIEAHADTVEVMIGTNTDIDSVFIKIKDNGDGIPEDLLSNIWVSFFTTKGPKSHGLGLPATLHIVSQHRGTISVDSTVGEGSLFTLSFPIGRQPENVISPSIGSDFCLISEENYYSKWCTNLFAANQLQLTIASTFEDAPKKSTYLINGDQKGIFSLLEHRDDRKAGNTIVLSNLLTVEKTTRLLALGVDDVLLKPHSGSEFEDLLKN